MAVKTFQCYFLIIVCADLIRGAKEKNLKVKGPVRMPTKVQWRFVLSCNLKVSVWSFCEGKDVEGCVYFSRLGFYLITSPVSPVDTAHHHQEDPLR